MIRCGWQPSQKTKPEQTSPTVENFFDRIYLAMVTETKRRKVPCSGTLARRRAAVRWWSNLMSCEQWPSGPPIDQVTEYDLLEFVDRLKTATYRRGSGPERPLSPVTQRRTVEEISIVLAASGPKRGKLIRAAMVDEAPSIYLEPLTHWPKQTWTLDEARGLAKAATTAQPNGWWRGSVEHYQTLARVTLAIWFYTGHRATTYRRLKFSDVREDQGQSFLYIEKSVKTGKQDRLAIHPQLLDSINACRKYSKTLIADWPIQYRALATNHTDWQRSAEIAPDRQFSPQAWRRFHCQMLIQTGFEQVMDVASKSLGHSSSSVTTSHYGNPRDLALLSLPDLFGAREC